MNKKERNLVILAGVLFAAVVVLRVVPLITGYYADGQQEITRLQNRIDNYRQLIAETGRWIEREQAMRGQVEEMAGWVFTGSSANFIVTSVQRQLTRTAAEAGLTVRETPLPTFVESGDWLVVNQEISFLLDRQEDILKFLNLLEKSTPHLFVTDFSISRNRRQYVGSLIVTGFGRTEIPALTATSADTFQTAREMP